MNNFEPQHILCAVDMSPDAAYALQWAALFAQAYSARLHVLHAAHLRPPLEFTHEQIDQVLQQLEEATKAAQELVTQWAEPYLPSGLPWQAVITRREPIEAILEQAEQLQAGLITMGSRRKSGLLRWLIGSVAEGVMHATTRPVLIAHRPENPLPPGQLPQLRRVMCPVNYTPVAQRCLNVSWQIAAKFSAELVVMHTAEDTSQQQAGAFDRLCRWVPDQARQSCQIREVVQEGNPAEQIVRYAQQEEVDLIVIGARRRLLAGAPVFGTTTQHVVRLAPTPVLVVHTQEDSAEE